MVVKIGTAALTARGGGFARGRIQALTQQLAALWKEGKTITVVSSGAIALGMEVLKLKRRPHALPELQACAAIGQGKLMKMYEGELSKRGIHTGQVLLTRDGLHDRTRYLNARNTLAALLAKRIIPIVNENDTVATEEIRFGDNDTLSAQVAGLVNADLLIVLSDVDGLTRHDGERISIVTHIGHLESELKPHIRDTQKEMSVGGMTTKIAAARITMQLGIHQVVADGHDPHVLARILAGKDIGTWFYAGATRREARKRWLAFSATSRGAIHVDAGAAAALCERGKSLLASGIIKAEGTFQVGDPVKIIGPDGDLVAQGLSNYSSDEVAQIRGKKTSDIAHAIGYKPYDEVIHRNNLVILSKKGS